ncbi:MAG: aminopeptidase P N-terminal domain-containing protein [Longimicrobiales bacterium]|nr:aminopeptidase P N-terminal domain-containing protein [Longimicrobiales bacterium]
MQPFPFEARRAALAERLGDSILVLPAAPQRVRSRDTMHRYVPDRELYWVTGLTQPRSCALLLGDGGGGLRFEIFLAEPDPEVEVWEGTRPGPAEAGERLGADAAHALGALEARVVELASGAGTIYFRLGAFPDVEPTVLRALERGRSLRVREGHGADSIVDPARLLDPLRMRKDTAELERLRRAAEITVHAFGHARERIRPGVGEWEIEGWLEGTFRSMRGDGPAFPSIVGGGENGCVLHYVGNACRLRDGDLVLVDAGAEFEGYAADISRTWPVSGGFTPEQLEIYRIVDGARQRAVDACRPGRTIVEVHEAAAAHLHDGLATLGVLASRDDREALKPFFPHRTSHWLGLDVHDAGGWVNEGGDPVVLEPGMVLTVEPGLYFGRPAIEAGRGAAETFRGIGIRLEDDVVVTEGDPEVITAGAPTDPDEITSHI